MRISYIIHHGYADLTEFDPSGAERLEIKIHGTSDGMIKLGASSFFIKGGRANIPLRELADGEYQPKIESEEGGAAADGFLKLGRTVKPLPIGEDRLREIVKRLRELENATDELKEKISKLETACLGHDIFNYERKIK